MVDNLMKSRVARRTRLVLLGLAIVAAWLPLTAQHKGLFPPEQLGMLEGPDRAAWQRPEEVMDALLIAEGSTVADLGAGGGWFTIRLANRVGPNGRVYAEDVQPADDRGHPPPRRARADEERRDDPGHRTRTRGSLRRSTLC